MGFPGSLAGKAACNAGDPSLIPGLGRSPGEGNIPWVGKNKLGGKNRYIHQYIEKCGKNESQETLSQNTVFFF